jgi:uncharacterized protein (TIGR03083 family)
MSQRAEELAAKFEQASNDLASKIQSLSDAEWRAKTPVEGWTVAATAHHAAGSPGPLSTMVAAAAGKAEMPQITQDMLNQMNADHAKQFASCSKDDALALLRETTPQAAEVLRGLSDAELQRTATMPFGMQMSAEQIAENVLVGHVIQHTQSMTDGAASA